MTIGCKEQEMLSMVQEDPVAAESDSFYHRFDAFRMIIEIKAHAGEDNHDKTQKDA